MSLAIQFDFFEPIPSETDMMRMDIKDIHESTEKVRKKLFAENGQLKKRVNELENRLEILERNICRGTLKIT